jgi:hypothetical protein
LKVFSHVHSVFLFIHGINLFLKVQHFVSELLVLFLCLAKLEFQFLDEVGMLLGCLLYLCFHVYLSSSLLLFNLRKQTFELPNELVSLFKVALMVCLLLDKQVFKVLYLFGNLLRRLLGWLCFDDLVAFACINLSSEKSNSLS